MKAMKKIVLLLLCLAMVLSMAACGGNATTETKSETTTTAPETSETASETTADPANSKRQPIRFLGTRRPKPKPRYGRTFLQRISPRTL